jgi:Fic family protein
MKRTTQGHYVTVSTVGEKVEAFIPAPLPPLPPIDWTADLREKMELAHLALGRLDSVSVLLPETSMFLYMYVRKEAVLSSQIEGTQSSLTDLLFFEMAEQPGVPLEDVQEVSNYVAALQHGLKRITEGFPLSLRLIREIHKVLLSKGRGSDRDPGEFRRSQNWIGGTRPGTAVFVPPPPEQVQECMGKLELFLHDQPERTPPLLKAALAHVQFETIHPFLDGNGRLGRLLITLILCAERIIIEPMLYLSLCFKNRRQSYYDLLNNVRISGDWESWLSFFADAVTDTATQAVDTARKLTQLAADDRAKIGNLGRIAGSALRIHRAMLELPIVYPRELVIRTGLSVTTVINSLERMQEIGVVKESTGRKRNRIFSYTEYMTILDQGTEPLS